MDALRWQRIQAIFHEALGKPQAERAAYVEQSCLDDNAMCAEVLSMLDHDEQASPLFDKGLAYAAGSVLGGNWLLPARIGPYRLGQRIGEGGMGVVFEGFNEELGNRVAIKLQKDAWLSPARRDRFASEQRLLARLTHPAIARIYHSGTLDGGNPWFAMEFVEGRNLVEYCRQEDLSLRERVALFRQVCEAVQFAHNHLVLHRDLKPPNILVTHEGVVKLLDFGVAKPLDGSDTPVDQTITGLRMLTPGYAAPEQVMGEPVGTYTDVYALGAILCELLTGQLPLDLAGSRPRDAERLISERDPVRPSERAKQDRAGQPLRVSRSEWADLDVMCLKALKKAPPDRYSSVTHLLVDVNHFLAGEPLEARPDSLRYRAGKFVRRNRRRLVTVAVAALFFLGSGSYYTWRITVERTKALKEAAKAQRVQAFMGHLFQGDEASGPSQDLKVVDLLKRGVKEARALDSEPEVQAELYLTLGNVYEQLGQFDEAEPLLSASSKIKQSVYGANSAEYGAALVELGALRDFKGQTPEAKRLISDGLARLQRNLPADSLLILAGITRLAAIEKSEGGNDKAIAMLEKAVAGQPKTAVSSELLDALNQVAIAKYNQGRYDESEALFERLRAANYKMYGTKNPVVADTLISLAAIRSKRGESGEAEQLLREALRLNRAWYGSRHLDTGETLRFLAEVLVQEGKYQEAEEDAKTAVAVAEENYPKVHSKVALALSALGNAELHRRRLDKAERTLQQAVTINEALYHDRNAKTGLVMDRLGDVYFAKEDYGRAQAFYENALRIVAKIMPADHPDVAAARIRLGRLLARKGAFAKAERELREGQRILTRKGPRFDKHWIEIAAEELRRLDLVRGRAGSER